ncbi:MAG: hypothetical protein ACLQRH_20175 [Acidimicrobiales bacterium]
MPRFKVEFEVVPDPKDPRRLWLVTHDRRFTGPTGGPGLRMAVSANRRSVDENEHTYNRLVQAMGAEGYDAPPPVAAPRRRPRRR